MDDEIRYGPFDNEGEQQGAMTGWFALFPAIVAVALSSFGVATGDSVAGAAALTPEDRAWIEQCIAARKKSDATRAALRGYCECMHGAVENNEPLGITELERSYPPAHRACWRKQRMG